ncbi:interferon gamma receptor 1-like isoform X2 [Entelurus aequoreus]|uniref:interferon gamma receptor 1-like isoform X2 n=1 Tax=Entelurus aequoreus TaxID=161455 RepID=UPI002B1D74E1|nr:interferon gamma receptor 1-like isoform X2 [Entelurus aequoreus]
MTRTSLMALLGVFFVLPPSTTHVAPPSNVTLHCGNLRNKVVWNYDSLPPGLQFRVDVGQVSDSNGRIAPLWVDPPHLQADVSFLSDPDNDYSLTVTAVLGENQSEPAPADGIDFSYYRNSPASQICSLDLPPVTVLEQQDHSVLLSFQHPWLLYHQKLSSQSGSRKKKRHEQPDDLLPVFKYDVTINQKQFAELSCSERVCEKMLPVDPQQEKHCVTIRGVLNKMKVDGTQDYCALPMKGNKVVVVSVLVSLLVLAGVAMVFIMCCRQHTKASFDPPSSLEVSHNPNTNTCTLTPVQEAAHVPEVTCSVSSLHDQELLSNPSGEPDADVQEEEQEEEEEEEEEEEGYMGGDNLEEDLLDSFNPYEKRCAV